MRAQGVLSTHSLSSPQGDVVRWISRCECPHVDRERDASQRSNQGGSLGYLILCPVLFSKPPQPCPQGCPPLESARGRV